jgi:predicted nucleic acid-binding protein
MRYVLDSTFLIDLLRQDRDANVRFVALMDAGDDPIVSDVTTAEVWSGRRDGGDDEIERFLRYFEYVHPGPATGRMAGEFRARARTIGRTLDIPDALIAATAMDLDAVVLTRNVRDFELTPVRVESY